MAPDLILYGIIAAGLVFWLRNVLGTRHGEERERPNPYIKPLDVLNEAIKDDLVIDGKIIDRAESNITDLHKNPSEHLSIRDAAAQDGLLAIARADKTFDIKDFISKAQDAFVYIVEAYAEGDIETLQDMTSDSVLKAFKGGIKAREKTGETNVTEILSFDKTDVLEARLSGKSAYVTLRFAAQQTHVTRDEAGAIIAGSENNANVMIDIWTFTRKISSNDPRWFLHETRSDDPDDNDIIPNTDDAPKAKKKAKPKAKSAVKAKAKK